MVSCKAREFQRSEAYFLYAAATRNSCNAADGRLPTASWQRLSPVAQVWRSEVVVIGAELFFQLFQPSRNVAGLLEQGADIGQKKDDAVCLLVEGVAFIEAGEKVVHKMGAFPLVLEHLIQIATYCLDDVLEVCFVGHGVLFH